MLVKRLGLAQSASSLFLRPHPSLPANLYALYASAVGLSFLCRRSPLLLACLLFACRGKAYHGKQQRFGIQHSIRHWNRNGSARRNCWVAIFHTYKNDGRCKPPGGEHATGFAARMWSRDARYLADTKLRLGPVENIETVRPRLIHPVLLRFLPAFAFWSLVTGSFMPFAAIFLQQHLKMPLRSVGLIFSGSQFAQVFAVLLAPILYRQLGTIAGIMCTQIATGVAVFALGQSQSIPMAVACYLGYTGAQFMSGPGFYSMLMIDSREERSNASAIQNIVGALSQAGPQRSPEPPGAIWISDCAVWQRRRSGCRRLPSLRVAWVNEQAKVNDCRTCKGRGSINI